MTENTRRRFLQLAGGATAVALAGCTGQDDGTGGGSESTDDGMNESMGNESMDDGSMDDGSMDDGSMDDGSMASTITVRIENVSPTDFYGSDSHTGGGVWITPGAFAVHTDRNPIYTEGETASIGLEALAEAGPPTGFEGEPGLVDELQEMSGNMGVVSAGAYTPENTVVDPNDPMGEVPGAPPIAPGGAFEFEVEAQPGQRLSFASMFVPSNDVFIAPGADGIALWPEDGEPVSGDVTDAVGLYDAGTEPNGEPGYGPDQAPAQDSADQGADEGGVVRLLGEVDDGYEYPAASEVIQVTLSPQ